MKTKTKTTAAPHPLSRLGRSEVARFRIPYVVIADGKCAHHTYDPEEAQREARARSGAEGGGRTAVSMRVGDADSSRWFRGGAEVGGP